MELSRHASLRGLWLSGRAGASPVLGTKTELNGFRETELWAAQSAAHFSSLYFFYNMII